MAWTRKHLPVPGGPRNSTSCASRMKRQVARSKSCARLIDGLNDQSNSSSGFSSRKSAAFTRRSICRSCRTSSSSCKMSSRNSAWLSLMAGRFLQPHVKRFGQAREAKLMQRGLQAIIHGVSPGGTRKGELRWKCPVKRSRALLRSNLARDSRTWAEERPRRPADRHRSRGVFVALRYLGILLSSHAL